MTRRPTAPTDEFLEHAAAYGIEFEGDDLDRLERFLARLLEVNRVMNLTAITDPGVAWMRHIFDSLTLLPYVVEIGAQRMIDVGSGGGFPGMPLAIVAPVVQVTLLEATKKKVKFLRETASDIGLANVTVISQRAETAGHDPAHRETCDLAVARAVGPLKVLIELTSPFVRVGACIIAIKGARAETEVRDAKRALSRLRCAVIDQRRTPTNTLVIIEKSGPTPRKYPRAPGEPKRNPLG